MKTQITTVEIDNAKQSINLATEEARHILAQEAQDAKMVISSAAAAAVKVAQVQDKADHDLLIRVDEKLDALTLVTNKIQDGTSTRLDKVEAKVLALEQCHEQNDPQKIAKIAYDGLAWRRQFDVIWKVTLGLVGLISLILGIVIGTKDIIRF